MKPKMEQDRTNNEQKIGLNPEDKYSASQKSKIEVQKPHRVGNYRPELVKLAYDEKPNDRTFKKTNNYE